MNAECTTYAYEVFDLCFANQMLTLEITFIHGRSTAKYPSRTFGVVQFLCGVMNKGVVANYDIFHSTPLFSGEAGEEMDSVFFRMS